MAEDPTRERLLEAAERLFAEKGYEGATLRAICARARVNCAAVNYHFGSKRRLYVDTLKRAYSKQAPYPDWPPGTPAEVRLREFLRTFLGRTLEDESSPAHRKLMLRELAQPSEATEEVVRAFIQPQFQRLLEILEELMPPGICQRRRYLVAFSVVGQCLYYRVARPVARLLMPPEEFEHLDPEVLAEHIARVTLASLGVEPPVTAG